MRDAIRSRWTRALVASCGFGLLIAPPPAAALSVTIDPVSASSFVNVLADNGTGSLSTFSFLELSVPFADSHTAARFATVSTTSYDFTDLGFAISIDDHQRSANLDSYALSRGQIVFSVDESAQYVVSGLYQAQNPPEARLHFGVELRDRVSDEIVYTTFLESLSTPNETLEVGVGGGDSVNFELGARMGSLEADREYRFTYSISIQAPVAPTAAASATGFLRLELSPEPAAVRSLDPSGMTILAGLFFAIAIAGIEFKRRNLRTAALWSEDWV